jgi:cytochrome P450
MTAIPEPDPAGTDLVADPYPAYARLRARGPQWSSSLKAWLVADHRSVLQLLRSPLLVRAPRRADAVDDAHRSLQRVEHEAHARLRSTIADVFHGAGVQPLKGLISRRADELVRCCTSGDALDLMAGLAHPLSIHTIALVLGLPVEDLSPLVGWSTAIAAAMGPLSSQGARSAADAARAEAGEYVERVVADRMARPAPDLVSRLAADGRLTRGETQAMVRLLLFTGAHTVALAVGNALDLLARSPMQLETLQRRPALVPRAIEECLRFEAVIQLTSRRTTADCIVGGAWIRAGEEVALLLGSANRDERIFLHADVFDVARRPGPHLAFARGIHACPAPVLARHVLCAALEALLRRVSTILPDREPVRLPTPVMRGYEVLPARMQRR